MTKDIQTEQDPPARCHKGRCLRDHGHHDGCKHDDGSEKYADDRALWKERACAMIAHRVGKVGRPGKLKRETTIAEAAEHCGIHRVTLQAWLKKKLGPKKQADEDPQVAQEKAARKKEQGAIACYKKAAQWAARANSVDTSKALAGNPEACANARGLARIAATQAVATFVVSVQAAPTLDEEERAAAMTMRDALSALLSEPVPDEPVKMMPVKVETLSPPPSVEVVPHDVAPEPKDPPSEPEEAQSVQAVAAEDVHGGFAAPQATYEQRRHRSFPEGTFAGTAWASTAHAADPGNAHSALAMLLMSGLTLTSWARHYAPEWAGRLWKRRASFEVAFKIAAFEYIDGKRKAKVNAAAEAASAAN